MRNLYFLLIGLLCFVNAHAQLNVSPLERKISVNIDNKKTEDIFLYIAEKAAFDFSYGSKAFDKNKIASLHVTNVTVRRALDLLFENRVNYKVRGNHIILTAAPEPLAVSAVAAPPKKTEYKLSGYITDQKTGYILRDVTIVDTARIEAVISDVYGFYSLTMPAGKQPVNIRIKRIGYFDTTISITPNSNLTADIALRPIPPPEPIVISPGRATDSLYAITGEAPDSTSAEFKRIRFEWANGLLNRAQRIQFSNLKDDVFKGNSQVSLVPGISTRGLLTGKTRNKYSFNLIAGYTGGTDVFEIGGALNIDRGDVKYVQIAGAANVVMGNVEGVQAAGAFNLVTEKVKGVQLAGCGNFALDSMYGIQLSGAVNVSQKYIYGIQGAGSVNGIIGNANCIQVSGAVNAIQGHLTGAQVSGWLNYAKKIDGLQAAGGANFVIDTMNTVQLAGAYNYGTSGKGVQIAGAVNWMKYDIEGVQFSALLNRTGKLNGFQVGTFNICKEYQSGAVFGVLSFVKNGVHQIEISGNEKGFLTASFRTGIPRFYNIVSVGRGVQTNHPYWSVGYGAGTRFNLNQKQTLRLTVDYTVSQINRSSWTLSRSSLMQLTPKFEWAPVSTFAIAAGPVLNYYTNNNQENWFTPYIGNVLYEKVGSANTRRLWIGASVSIRFL
ncbi:MAG: hypothetical protein MUC87_19010 [Bacteroidia bacterium]|jgi:hypothetical protein|nr:hypothetical protein [Bacteroidia bacterium]